MDMPANERIKKYFGVNSVIARLGGICFNDHVWMRVVVLNYFQYYHREVICGT